MRWRDLTHPGLKTFISSFVNFAYNWGEIKILQFFLLEVMQANKGGREINHHKDKLQMGMEDVKYHFYGGEKLKKA